ncbi:DUF4097 domain-containing protein [Calidifontibacter sp. DB0510]|uniref:DUF4097 domain-containing protein n=1 Tax=Metallococcus carri TaxID=1656884 RepID=A0A967B165_9MICO|nr:DUF4097 family beta strand repeat-containing protein [Metallococcus carri]NHN56408.1 DUF4097 domain-containing protein [Metallococcus carri]NOP36032.1 DUF4097 family beta strand repeat protein [Calidifontibacter sp. DB2511S]
MSEQWEITGPKVLDIGDEHERVEALDVGLVAGRVDVVTHDDSPTARIEAQEIEGRPLRVTWDGRMVRVTHVQPEHGTIWESLKAWGSDERARAVVSISVPSGTQGSVSTVSAEAVVSGLRHTAKVNTVSGDLTIDDLEGDIDAHTVSGSIEGLGLRGSFTGNSVSGSITVQRSRLDPIRLNTVSGDLTMDLEQSDATVRSSSVSGDVTLRLAPGTGYAVRVTTMSGTAVVDGRKITGMLGKGGTFTEGNGGLKVKANSVSGNVTILRGGHADAGATLATDPT